MRQGVKETHNINVVGKNVKNEHRQKHVILEGFSQNGLQIRNQRIFLRIVAEVKVDFGHFFRKLHFFDMKIVKNCIK